MWGRNSGALLALSALIVLAGPAFAQNDAPPKDASRDALKDSVAVAPLGQTDPWSVGWLGKADGAVANTIWSGTDTTTLAQLMADLQPTALSPAARQALRRIVLSSTRGPRDGANLIPERLRLIELVGETERSVDLRKRFPNTDWGKDADLLASSYELAAGRSQSACARVADKAPDLQPWMPLRALCYAIAGDLNAAGGISEHTQGADGQPDTWLIAALSTVNAAAKAKPPGRYDTALSAAVSITAKLSVPNDAMGKTPPDIALAILRHPDATLEQKRNAMRIVADANRLVAADALAVLNAPADAPAPGSRAASRAKPDFLAMALTAAADRGFSDDARAAAFAAAFKGAETPTDFHIAAIVLHSQLKSLPKSDATQPNAEAFVRAALAAGDLPLAIEWRKLMDRKPPARPASETPDKTDPGKAGPSKADKNDKAEKGEKSDKVEAPEAPDLWAAARLDLMLSFAGAPGEKPADILDRLIDAVPPAPETASKAATPAQRQAELRRIENTRALFLYVGSGRALNPAARTLLGTLRTAGRGVPDGALARIQAALNAKADGEAALAAIAQVGGDPSAVSFAGLADLIAALHDAGLDKDANAIALEALQPWKAL
jgi:hypothetical protein